MSASKFTVEHLAEVRQIAERIDAVEIDRVIAQLVHLRDRQGRLFFIGVGGSAGNCSHAVNDFRKLLGIEAYSPTDNVSELTARTNDEGWSTVFSEWLKVSRLRSTDMLFILSVGGGDLERKISANIVTAIQHAREVGAGVVGIVGRDAGYTAQSADACIVVPVVNPDKVTPHSEAFQAVIWHLIVSHPSLTPRSTKWESVV